MCGRFSLTSPLAELRALFGFEARPNLRPRANIAPTQQVLALRAGPGADGGGGQGDVAGNAPGNEPGAFFPRWGLVPSWADDPAVGARMINARAETLAEKPAFREAFRRRRCLIPADGFYEWRAAAGGRRQPWRIARPDGGPFAFAGLWEAWRDPARPEPLLTCTIVTTEANADLRDLHPRMPVVLDPADHARWLDPAAEEAALRSLLRPAPEGLLESYPVSPAVNDVRNDSPELLRPTAPLPPAPVQASLF